MKGRQYSIIRQQRSIHFHHNNCKCMSKNDANNSCYPRQTRHHLTNTWMLRYHSHIPLHLEQSKDGRKRWTCRRSNGPLGLPVCYEGQDSSRRERHRVGGRRVSCCTSTIPSIRKSPLCYTMARPYVHLLSSSTTSKRPGLTPLCFLHALMNELFSPTTR